MNSSHQVIPNFQQPSKAHVGLLSRISVYTLVIQIGNIKINSTNFSRIITDNSRSCMQMPSANPKQMKWCFMLAMYHIVCYNTFNCMDKYNMNQSKIQKLLSVHICTTGSNILSINSTHFVGWLYSRYCYLCI